MALRNEFAVPNPIDWSNFGLSKGIDDKLYSIFGPTEALISVPFFEIGRLFENKNLLIDSNYIPLSFHVLSGNEDAGLYFIQGKRPPSMNGQYVRFITSFFNSVIGAIAGLFFYFVLVEITKSKVTSFVTTFLFSFGSLLFPYTGTFFSEPLCTLFIIISFLFIVKNETPGRYNYRNYFYSGLFLGLAITTHISAVLSVPFYFMFILGQVTKDKFKRKYFLFSNLYFTLGLLVFCGLLLYYNDLRFGNVLETGRTASLYSYAIYSNPITGLYGLLFSPGKGLFIYCPIIILSIISWKSFHKRYSHLSIAVLGMIIIRLFFIASRSDWHGGFCMGPRYFVIIMPFLFIPIAFGLKEILVKKTLKCFVSFCLFGFICISQQIFFSVGEIFSYLHIIYRQEKIQGIEILIHNSLYLDWKYAPAIYLLNYKEGPFLLKFISSNNYFLWFLMSIIFLLFFLIILYNAYRSNYPDQSVLS